MKGGAKGFARVSPRFSDKFLALKRWSSALAVKVAVGGWEDGKSPPFLGIALIRYAESWRLVFASANEKPIIAGPPKQYDWRLLTGASLEVKVAACELLPELLKKIARAQKTRLKEITEASDSLEKLAGDLGLNA